MFSGSPGHFRGGQSCWKVLKGRGHEVEESSPSLPPQSGISCSQSSGRSQERPVPCTVAPLNSTHCFSGGVKGPTLPLPLLPSTLSGAHTCTYAVRSPSYTHLNRLKCAPTPSTLTCRHSHTAYSILHMFVHTCMSPMYPHTAQGCSPFRVPLWRGVLGRPLQVE